MKVRFTYLNKSTQAFNSVSARNWIGKIIKIEGKRGGEISFIITDDDHLLEINKFYLKHDYFTDVISFSDRVGKSVSGEVYISYERVIENAELYGTDSVTELYRVIVHGVLHLIGYDDDTEIKRLEMTKRENMYIGMGKEEFGL